MICHSFTTKACNFFNDYNSSIYNLEKPLAFVITQRRKTLVNVALNCKAVTFGDQTQYSGKNLVIIKDPSVKATITNF